MVVVSVRCQSVRGMFYSRHAKRRSDSLVFLLEERGDAYAYNARDTFHNNNSGTGKNWKKRWYRIIKRKGLKYFFLYFYPKMQNVDFCCLTAMKLLSFGFALKTTLICAFLSIILVMFLLVECGGKKCLQKNSFKKICSYSP